MLKVPAAARRAAAELSSRRGVVGVFWGTAARNGKRTGEHGFVVHVRKKLPVKQLGRDRVPPRLAGYRTDVIEIGGASHHWLDPTDLVQCQDSARGRSTITALGTRQGRAYALLSGHGTLSAQNGELANVFNPASPMRVRALDPTGTVFPGDLQAGQLDASCDFSLALMEAGVDDINAYHYAAGESPPLTVRTSSLRENEEVAHFSSLRGRMMIGRILQVAVGYVNIPGYGGHDYPYLDLVSIESIDASLPFSVHGDSGSLVVDRKQRVIGTVVAGESDRNLSYVLLIGGTVSALGANARMFFQDEE